MSGFYGYTYVWVWYRASSALLLLALQAMELKELFPVEGQSLAGVSRDSSAGCVDELNSPRALPSAPARLYWQGGGSSGCLCCCPAPLAWEGQCIPFPYNSPWSWRSLWTWWFRLNSKRDGEAASACIWQRQSHGHPWTAPAHSRSRWSSIPVRRMGFVGWNLNRGKKLPLLYTRRKHQPPIQDNSPEQQMLVEHRNKGSNSAPTHAKTPKPNQITAPVDHSWWVDSLIKQRNGGASLWVLLLVSKEPAVIYAVYLHLLLALYAEELFYSVSSLLLFSPHKCMHYSKRR